MPYSDTKRVLDSDDHPEPNLIGAGMVLDSIREASDEHHRNTKELDLLDQLKDPKLVTTTTDGRFETIINRDKARDPEHLKLYNPDTNTKTESHHYNTYKETHKTEHSEHDRDGDRDDRDRDSERSHDHRNSSSEFASEEEETWAKLDMLRKLGELKQNYGVQLSQLYSINSSYKAMKFEYELHKSIRDKANGVKWMSNMLLNMCYGIEMGNEYFNPFDFHLKGWSEQMAGEQKDYYEVLGELYEKYFKTGKPIPPEIKIMFMISGSALQFHLTHTLLSNVGNIQTELGNDPALAEKLRQQAAADRMRTSHEKQKAEFEKHSSQMHEQATQKATDLNKLKEQKEEYEQLQQQAKLRENEHNKELEEQMFKNQMMGESLREKERQLDILQRQLNNQRSDSWSMHDGNSMSMPVEQPIIAPPRIPASLRRAQLEEARKEQEIKRRRTGGANSSHSSGSGVHVKTSSFGDLMKSQDTKSRISEGSVLDLDEISGASKRRNKRRRWAESRSLPIQIKYYG